jgi:hypothetical protein
MIDIQSDNSSVIIPVCDNTGMDKSQRGLQQRPVVTLALHLLILSCLSPPVDLLLFFSLPLYLFTSSPFG